MAALFYKRKRNKINQSINIHTAEKQLQTIFPKQVPFSPTNRWCPKWLGKQKDTNYQILILHLFESDGSGHTIFH